MGGCQVDDTTGDAPRARAPRQSHRRCQPTGRTNCYPFQVVQRGFGWERRESEPGGKFRIAWSVADHSSGGEFAGICTGCENARPRDASKERYGLSRNLLEVEPGLDTECSGLIGQEADTGPGPPLPIERQERDLVSQVVDEERDVPSASPNTCAQVEQVV